MKKLTLSILMLLLQSTAHAAYVASRDFLAVGHGARANAMGEAFVAVADDASAIYWNAAGLTQLQEDEVSTGYANRFEGLAKEAQLHYAWRGRKSMWGVGYVGSYVNEIPVTQSLTQADLDAIQNGTFAATDYPTKNVMDHAVLVSYSRPIRPESPHSVGTTMKLIYRDILGMVRGYGSAFDLGYLYASESSYWKFGMNVQNAASLTSFVGSIDNLGVNATATESYIPNVKTGIAVTPPWRILHGKMLLALDMNMLTSFHLEDYHAGVEYSFGDNISLRAGKTFQRQEKSSEDYSLGMGIRLQRLTLDFSFLSNELGQTTRGTIGYRLGSDYYTPRKY